MIESVKLMEVVEKVKELLGKNNIPKSAYWNVEVSYRSGEGNIEWSIYLNEGGIDHCKGRTAIEAVSILQNRLEMLNTGQKDVEIEHEVIL